MKIRPKNTELLQAGERTDGRTDEHKRRSFAIILPKILKLLRRQEHVPHREHRIW